MTPLAKTLQASIDRETGNGAVITATVVRVEDASLFTDNIERVTLRLIFAELKTNRGKLTPQQENWIKALYPFAEAVVWRPADWPAIVRSLR